MAEETIAGRGAITGEFFDEGCSRRLSWWQRPAAAALLASVTSGAREFDAVVVGEYERAFCGEQFRSVMALLQERGVELWLPEVGGPVDAEDPTHQALMMLLGAQSRREVVRARHRVLAAMRVQAGEQGRFLGGRPPYGFRLVDDGPHRNRAHARWGRRRRRLDPDPDTAPWVRWIFEQRANGRSVAGLALELNERGVRCPSGADRVRNPHRPGQEWMVRTVTGILENPRYTGREVWNRHSTEGRGGDHARRAGGTVRRTQVKDWVLSDRQVHPALVSDELFLAVQGMRTARRTHDGGTRRYVLAGLLVCDVCGRRLDSHWANGRAGYRCRHGYTSARGRPQHAAKNVYVREDRLLVELRERLTARPGCEPTEMADHLRRRGQMIVCAGSSWTVEDAASLPARITPGFGGMQLLLPME